MDNSLKLLNAAAREARLSAAREIAPCENFPERTRFTNNHIHTTYSFSPYSPTAAVRMARAAGLCTAGIMDHDSCAGALEFVDAGKIFGLPVTVGVECRVTMEGTPFAGRRTNNPDQTGVSYVALHGIPHSELPAVAAYFAPYMAARGRRNEAMIPRLNALLPDNLQIDYACDVLPLSQAHDGGTVTERHILYAVALKIAALPDPAEVMEGGLGLALSEKMRENVRDAGSPNQAYDILNVLKSSLVERFFIPATDECPPVRETAEFCKKHGIIFAYAYLGDVRGSVTGDKKDQLFEDEYLDELAAALPGLGFSALTYMPSRNTPEQLARVQSLCREHGLFEISGEDINQLRQSFVCQALAKPECAHLYDAAWALIGHEARAGASLSSGLFGAESIAAQPDLTARVREFSQYAQNL